MLVILVILVMLVMLVMLVVALAIAAVAVVPLLLVTGVTRGRASCVASTSRLKRQQAALEPLLRLAWLRRGATTRRMPLWE